MEARGRAPDEIVYCRTPTKGILGRNPDLASILEGEGYSIVVIDNPYPDTIHRAARINIHPKFQEVEILRLEHNK